MKYEQPAITAFGSAIEAVQNTLIKEAPAVDTPSASTPPAYPSDEA